MMFDIHDRDEWWVMCWMLRWIHFCLWCHHPCDYFVIYLISSNCCSWEQQIQHTLCILLLVASSTIWHDECKFEALRWWVSHIYSHQHGVPRPATRAERTAEVRKKELQEIDHYQKLVEQVKIGVSYSVSLMPVRWYVQVEKKDYTPELLEQTSALLKKNPEYYTIWNVRRNIFQNEFHKLKNQVESNELTEDRKQSQVLDIINLDLYFLLPLLLQYPKCYWIWNHRLWVLEQGTEYLAPAKARSLWQDELNLVNKMLGRDGRNFHGWGYRRIVVAALEDPKLEGESLAKDEYDYTTKMIRQNLSNFSAWHNRTQLIRRMLDEQGAGESARLKMLFDGKWRYSIGSLADVVQNVILHTRLWLMCTISLFGSIIRAYWQLVTLILLKSLLLQVSVTNKGYLSWKMSRNLWRIWLKMQMIVNGYTKLCWIVLWYRLSLMGSYHQRQKRMPVNGWRSWNNLIRWGMADGLISRRSC